MKGKGVLALALFAATAWVQSRLVQAQEVLTEEPKAVSLTTYNDLLRRIELLERQQPPSDENPFRDDPEQPTLIEGGGDDTCGSSSTCDCCQPRTPSGYYALYENVIVRPYFTHNTAFVIPDGTNQIDVSFSWGLQYTPRVELGYLNPCGNIGWRARWWHFDHSTSVPSQNVNVQIAFGAEDSPVANGNSVIATHGLHLDTIDWELIKRGCRLTFSGGLRYLSMEQTYLFIDDLNTAPELELVAVHDFEGLGPTVAVQVESPTRWCGLSLYSIVRGSILFGESTLFAADNNDAGPLTNDILIRENSFDVIAIGELQLGIDWKYQMQCREFFIRTGLEGQFWMSPGAGGPGGVHFENGDANSPSGDVQDAHMGLFGLTAAIGFVY